MPDYNLKGKKVIVGGGSSGIGLAIAHAFAREGCTLHLLARSRKRLEEASQSIRVTHGTSVTVHPVDFGDHDQLSSIITELGDADILVNNGAAAPSGSIEALAYDDWRDVIDRKLLAYIVTTRTILPKMYARKSGVVINIIGGGVVTKYDYVCGTSANAALAAFTTAVGSKSTDHNVRVIGVNPTATRTETFDTMIRQRAKLKLGSEDKVDELLAQLPFSRACQPEEVASLVVFLASPLATYISGTCINIDGGAPHR